MSNEANLIPIEEVLLDKGSLPRPVDWTRLFGNEHPVEIEIGSGKGGFLVQRSGNFPEHNYLGLEKVWKMAEYTAGRLAKRALRNVRIVPVDAHFFLARHVKDASVAALHVYFPDPWPKKRHQKRRLISDEFLRELRRVLAPDARVHFATDFQDYYEYAGEVFERFPEFEALNPTDWVRSRPEEAITNYEVKYRREGRPIYYALYRLKA